MKIKESLKYMLPFAMGLLVFGIIFDILSNTGLMLYWNLINPEHFFFSKTLRWVLSIASILTVIFGGILGVKKYKNKNQYYEIFKITKPNLITNLLVVLLVNIYGYITTPFPFDYKVITGNIFFFILFYPFSAIFYHLTTNFKDSKDKLVLILLLILMNPLFITASISFNIYLAYLPEVPQEECGVIIQDLTEQTVFPNQSVGKQIVSINGVNITSFGVLTEELQEVNSTEPVEFNIEGEKYTVEPFFDSETNKYKFGFYPSPLMCNVTS